MARLRVWSAGQGKLERDGPSEVAPAQVVPSEMRERIADNGIHHV